MAGRAECESLPSHPDRLTITARVPRHRSLSPIPPGRVRLEAVDHSRRVPDRPVGQRPQPGLHTALADDHVYHLLVITPRPPRLPLRRCLLGPTGHHPTTHVRQRSGNPKDTAQPGRTE